MSALQVYVISLSSLSLISTGDWICKVCSNDNGIKVGIEGHEYKAGEEGEETEAAANNNNKPLVIESEDLHIPKKKKKKKKKQKKRKFIDPSLFDLSDSDDSDEEYSDEEYSEGDEEYARWIGMR